MRFTRGRRGGLTLEPSHLAALVHTGDLLAAAVSGAVEQVISTAYVVLGAVAALATLVGIVLFSVGMTRARVYPRPAIWVFLGGIVLGLVSEMAEQSLRGPVPWPADVLPPLGFVVAGVGLLALGRAALSVPRP